MHISLISHFKNYIFIFVCLKGRTTQRRREGEKAGKREMDREGGRRTRRERRRERQEEREKERGETAYLHLLLHSPESELSLVEASNTNSVPHIVEGSPNT